MTCVEAEISGVICAPNRKISPFLHQRVALADAQAAGADGLQFPALQRHARLEAILEVEIVACGLVQGDGLALSLALRGARGFVILCFVLGHFASLRPLSPIAGTTGQG
jgi:hypothetical protein